ncbi:50S ribosomal protein L10 [Candidatus Falkowbacteria bacterium CG11_big_fil_rev_8_21_14_0_20_39_10]|uniref:Large ribosomal subunit protein uL10 n=1 Tax=Candidatus Falkowbacteria bacterium CG11_big_fil_rev_8_21_14_0_20_39_10 TaxID=1974570 RepID=A0A2M6KA81_9BACT|nr:MAG: 50S ribosomal protein L10 [Candidatus Falkowbacteria bacterium CG11_big_fil_rev_8_21_14_0_20_39_10]
MPKTKQQKKEILNNLSEKISRAKAVVFARFRGLGVRENEELRKKLKQENSEYFVAKKTLMDLAFKDLKIDGLEPRELEGRVAAIFGYDDEVAPARIIKDFKKEHPVENGQEEKIDFAGGILENKFISAEKVKELSELPSKQELYAKIVGSINAPVSGFVNVLAGNIRKLVYVLKAIEEKKN